MKSSQQNITVLDVDFDVRFSYTEGWKGTHWEPPEYPEVEIEDVLLDGWIITEIISDWTMQQIKGKIEIPSKYEEDADRADYLLDQQRDDKLTESKVLPYENRVEI